MHNDDGMALNDVLEKNSMLHGLPLSERQLITPSCELIELHLGDIIEEAGRPIRVPSLSDRLRH